MGRPAVVPIINRIEYLRLLTQPPEGINDLVIIHDAEDEMGKISTRQASIPVRHTRESSDYGSLCDREAITKINSAMNHIRRLIHYNKYHRIIFLADPPIYEGEDPPFARGVMGYDVQLYITELLYELGPFITCNY